VSEFCEEGNVEVAISMYGAIGQLQFFVNMTQVPEQLRNDVLNVFVNDIKAFIQNKVYVDTEDVEEEEEELEPAIGFSQHVRNNDYKQELPDFTEPQYEDEEEYDEDEYIDKGKLK
jgi:hypothetical protein